MAPPMKLLPVLLAVVAVVWADAGNKASPDVLPRIACPDDRYKPCGECKVSFSGVSNRVARWVCWVLTENPRSSGSMCCTPLERCSYIDIIGYSCFERNGASSSRATVKTGATSSMSTVTTDASSPTGTSTATSSATDLSTLVPTTAATQPAVSPSPNSAAVSGRGEGKTAMFLLGLAILSFHVLSVFVLS